MTFAQEDALDVPKVRLVYAFGDEATLSAAHQDCDVKSPRLFGGGGSAHGAEDNDQLYHYRQSYPYPGQDGQDASPACHSLL